MQTLKIGIVGVGFIGKCHIDAIRRIPNTQIVAVADTDAVSANNVAQSLGIAVAYETVTEMLKLEDLDIVHNCTPTFMHHEINLQIIAAGKHLYCEKPLALNATQADALVDKLKHTRIANGVNFCYRMSAMTQELHERLKDGCAGRPLMVTGSYIQDWMLYKDDYDWRLNPKYGGRSRAIADIGTHLFDLSQYVLGKRIVEVNAHTLIAHTERLHYEKAGGTFSTEKGPLVGTVQVKNEDAAQIMVHFEDGTDGMFQVSQISAGHKNDLRLRIDMEQACYEWSQEDGDRLYIGKRGAPNEVLYSESAVLSDRAKQYSLMPAGHIEGWNDVLLNAIDSFYSSIWQGTYANENMPYATVTEGAWTMKIIEACIKSSEVGRWINVETGESL